MISLRDVVTGFGNRDPLAEVWRRNFRGGGGGSAVITGVPPLRYIGDGRPLTDYMLYGNAIQDGTPSADAPVDAVGSGVRTTNLFTGEYSQFDNIGGSGNLYAYFYAPNTTVTLIAKDDYTIPIGMYFGYTANGGDAEAGYRWMIIPGQQYAKGEVISRAIPEGFSFVSLFQKAEATFKRLTDHFYVMLNLGSEALQYEPYGYKLPLTVNGTEYPIYLGTVPTTRRIKKNEVSINRIVTLASGYIGAVTEDFIQHALSGRGFCDIFPYGSTSVVNSFYVNQRNAVFVLNAGTTLEDARELLNGHFVWYVLATEETAIVNEPLMKIGDYADTISFAQSQVTIPTVNGENVLDVPTTPPPSEITIKGGIRSV